MRMDETPPCGWMSHPMGAWQEIINGIHRHSPNPVRMAIKANRHGALPEKSGIRVAPNRNQLLDRESAIEPTPSVTFHYQ